MFKNKLKSIIGDGNDGNNKKKIENLVFLVIVLIITVVVINYIWNGNKSLNKTITNSAGRQLASSKTSQDADSNQSSSSSNSESLETIVEEAIHLSSTDIHLQCGEPIYLRHGDGLKATQFVCTTTLIEDILRRCGIASYEWQSLDEACSCCGVRIRVHLYRANQTICGTLRLLCHQQLKLDDNMSDGIRDALREDPDVIMVGELRDRETLEAALHAAETGHLVMATMHTQRAVMAVHRMISLFPGEQQEEVRSQISQVLRAVICQRLLRWNKKFITIRDILLNTHAVANLIRTRKEPQIISIQETQLPMKTLEMAVRDAKVQYGSQQQLHTLLDQQLS